MMTIKSFEALKSMCEGVCILKSCDDFKILGHVAPQVIVKRF